MQEYANVYTVMSSLGEHLSSNQDLRDVTDRMHSMVGEVEEPAEPNEETREDNFAVEPQRKPVTGEKKLFETSEAFMAFQLALVIKDNAAKRFAKSHAEPATNDAATREKYRDIQRKTRDEVIELSKKTEVDTAKIGRHEAKLINKFLGVNDGRTMELLEMAHEITEKASEVQIPPYKPSRFLVAEGREPVAKLLTARDGVQIETSSLTLDMQKRSELEQEYAAKYNLTKTQSAALELFLAMSPEERERASSLLVFRREEISKHTQIIDDELETEENDNSEKVSAEPAKQPKDEPKKNGKEEETENAELDNSDARFELANKKRQEAFLIMRRLGRVPIENVRGLMGMYEEDDKSERGKWIFDPIDNLADANGGELPEDAEDKVQADFDLELGRMAFENRKYFKRHIFILGMAELAIFNKLTAKKLFSTKAPHDSELKKLGGHLRRTFYAVYNTERLRILSAEDFGLEAR